MFIPDYTKFHDTLGTQDDRDLDFTVHLKVNEISCRLLSYWASLLMHIQIMSIEENDDLISLMYPFISHL